MNELAEFLNNNNVSCRKCQAWQIAKMTSHSLDRENETADFYIRFFHCLSCKAINFDVVASRGKQVRMGSVNILMNQHLDIVSSYPSRTRPYILPTVPDAVAADYTEAAKLLDVSAPASAAFARRCLQTALDAQGYDRDTMKALGKRYDLANQVEAALNERAPRKVLPGYIASSVDAIRNFGNFAAHGLEDKATAEIIEVEPGEAEWSLTVLEELLDHYYKRPAEEAKKLESLNEKLKAAGKPPVKAPLQEPKREEQDGTKS